MSNQGGERYYGILFPKGWIRKFSQDIRTANNGKTAREPSEEDFRAGEYYDGEYKINIESNKAFLVRAEESTEEEGQITLHFDRNEILINGQSMTQFLRNSTLGVVEFAKDGTLIHKRMF